MALIQAVGLGLALVACAAPSASELREQATREFRAKRFERACALFQRAADAAPGDGAVQADLGLCLEKVGQRERGIAATRRAIELGDEQTRRNAYFNLGRAGAVVALPAVGSCDTWRARSCPVALHACTFEWKAEGSRGGWSGVALRGAYEEGRARAAASEPYVGAISALDLEAGKGTGDVLDLVVDGRFGWYCGEPDAPGARTARRAPRCDPGEERVRCSVVHVDPCAGRVGIYCQRSAEGATKAGAAEYVVRRAP